jgi:hypothetical protein
MIKSYKTQDQIHEEISDFFYDMMEALKPYVSVRDLYWVVNFFDHNEAGEAFENLVCSIRNLKTPIPRSAYEKILAYVEYFDKDTNPDWKFLLENPIEQYVYDDHPEKQ